VSRLLEGRVAVVTGAGRGIGRAHALELARHGAKLVVNDYGVSLAGEDSGESPAHEVVAEIEAMGGEAVVNGADVADFAGAEAMVRQAIDTFGGLDILVNNAGFQMARDDTIEEYDDERIDRTFKTNLYALMWLCRAAIPHLRKGPGCIINNTSIQAYDPSTSLLDYAATKAAINNFTVNLAAQLGSDGIRVNAVAPGPVWTPLQPATQEPEKIERFGADTPLGRAGQPAEVAPAFVFLASRADASYVSGTVLGVTGGKPVF
jgi:NAD(P)-dependent dehydrogenase (short-subunit alcohol dehydrogenase family)